MSACVSPLQHEQRNVRVFTLEVLDWLEASQGVLSARLSLHALW